MCLVPWEAEKKSAQNKEDIHTEAHASDERVSRPCNVQDRDVNRKIWGLGKRPAMIHDHKGNRNATYSIESRHMGALLGISKDTQEAVRP